MRYLMIAVAAMLLFQPVLANAAQPVATDFAAKKKPKAKKAKVEYMRAAPMK
jgi:hypothetical protein